MVLSWHEPGAGLVAALLGARYAGGNSPWPTLIPPESVPELLLIRLLAICNLCPQAWTKMPPPPWELSVMPRPSRLDGLQWKLLGNGLCAVVVLAPQLAAVRSVVPVGKPANRVGSNGFCPW